MWTAIEITKPPNTSQVALAWKPEKATLGGAIEKTTVSRNRSNAVIYGGIASVAQNATANRTTPAAGSTPGVSVHNGAASSAAEISVEKRPKIWAALSRVSMGRRMKVGSRAGGSGVPL